MRTRGLRLVWALCLLLCTAIVARAQTPVVKVLFFHSPSCHKCEVLIEEYWPSMFEKYGDKLQVMFIDVSYPQNLVMWQAAEDDAGVAAQDHGVPGVIIGQNLIIGDEPIKAELGALIDAYLAQGGVGFPLLATATGTPGATPGPTSSPTPGSPAGGSSNAGLRPWLAGIAAALALGAGLLWSQRRRKHQS